jgi:large subunit ribosomal protein L31
MVYEKLEKHLNTRNAKKPMKKQEKHPEWYQTKVYCDGQLILEVGGTKKELFVDIWAGNHPFYTGSQKIIDTEGRVEKFNKKYTKTKE